MDSNHPSLSHQSEVVSQLASRFTRVTVITSEPPKSIQSSNVFVRVLKWEPGSHVSNALRLVLEFAKILKADRPTQIFTHMLPIHAAIISPFSRVLRIRHTLWYAHAAKPLSLRVATFLTNQVVSSTRGSYRIKSKKVVFIGQGIDSSDFKFSLRDFTEIKNILHVGRMDSSKGIPSIVEAVNNSRREFPLIRLSLVGNKSEDLELAAPEWLSIKGAVPRSDLPKIYSESEVFIHAFRGSLDKVLIEAVLTGLPVVTQNQEYLDHFFVIGSPSSDISTQLKNLLKSESNEIEALVAKNLEIAKANHEITAWINRLDAVILGTSKP